MHKKITLGIVGVRGYVGKELLTILKNHPQIDVCWVSSRSLCGTPVKQFCAGIGDFLIESLSPADVAGRKTDAVVLALPNGQAGNYVEAIEQQKNARLVIDLSADYRFNTEWFYSLPELSSLLNTAKGSMIKISNPGCYATAMQIALKPIIQLLANRAHCFGVSGYSGAGTTPSPNNNIENLKDNLIAYHLLEHTHEKEVSLQLDFPISFSPHVASFFRGINMTVQVEFKTALNKTDLYKLYENYYKNSPLIKIQKDIPQVKQVINTPYCVLGGIQISTDGTRASLVSCLDNLQKGAASQVLQNINLAFGLPETLGLTL